MKCVICNSDCNYFFSKKYTESPYDEFMIEIGKVDYFICENCGFVLSKTHCDLEKKQWEKLNYLVHNYHENPKNQKMGNQPPYIEQALLLMILGRNGIIKLDEMLDYAAGYGTLSIILKKYFNIRLPIFDQYVKDSELNKYVQINELSQYKVVINSAMFEHILTRDDLDNVNNLVDSEGCLIIHTRICGQIPNDPNWFYLRPPVHTAFHTNKSMEILMNQWGYESSIYCPQGRCWVLLKKDIENIENIIESINNELQTDYLYYKKGFVDFWKDY